jgi:hypothetical protein
MNVARRQQNRPWSIARALLVVAAIATATSLATSSAAGAAALNPIQQENSLPGTPGWDAFSSVGAQDAVSGYASKTSVNHGDSIDLYVTTTAANVKIDVFRVGWYQGIGARLVQSLGTFPGVHQPTPVPDPTTGMVSCTNWSKTTTLSVPSNWVTGVYLAKLTASSGNSSFIIFTVRNDGGTEPVLFQSSVSTYQAYNAYGGASLYQNTTNGSSYKYAEATKVSYDRPYDPLDGNGAGQFFGYEYPFIRWAESQGYNVSYITDVDTASNYPLTNHRVYLSVGHDEYWSHTMRDNVTQAIAHGMNAAFLSANSAYWQIRFEPNSLGVANRVQVDYKEVASTNQLPGPDPQWGVNNSLVTSRWRDDPVNLPENSFIGVMYLDQTNTDRAYVVQNASSWIYAGTGFTNGSTVPGIVGYEYDAVNNNGFSPPGLTVLSKSPVTGCCEGTGSSFANSTLYTAPGGGQVFASGTIQWSWGLDNYSSDGQFVNAGIQKTTANILDTFSAGASAPAPAVSLSPSSLAFGNQTVGNASALQTVTLTNSGNAALSINSIGLTGTNAGDFGQSSNCPASPSTLSPGATCTISVTFSPTAAGGRSASLSVTDNAPGSPQSAGLSGTGVALAPAVTLSPSSLTFSNQTVGTTSNTRMVTLTSSGTAPLSISNVGITGANAGDFVQSSNCPTSPSTLAPGQTCAISVSFSPTSAGSRTGNLSITDNTANSPESVALGGTGVAPGPAVSVTPAGLMFGSQQVGSSSGAQTVTVQSSGTAPLSITAISVAGANAGEFAESDTCPMAPATLAVNATCTMSVTFSPTASGARTANVAIADNAAGSPQSVGLSGTGTAPAVSLTPASLAFGSQSVGKASAAQTLTVKDSGTAPMSITGISVTGANASDFAQTSTCPVSPATLAAGASCAVSVTFTPAAVGSRTASLNVTDNAQGSPQTEALSGTGSTSSIAFDKALGKYSENVGTSSLPLTTSTAAASGSRVFVFVNWNDASGTLSSLSGGGLTWTIDVQAKDASGNHAAIASANAPNGLASATKLTATFSKVVANGLIAAASYTGIAGSAPVDVTGSNLQAGVAAWTGSVTTTNANDLVLGWSGLDANTTNTATVPNIKIYDFGDSNLWEWSTAEYRIETTTGPKTVNGTWARATGATANVTVIAAYKGS